MSYKILILCTGNSCRSQMADGFFRSFNNKLEVYSAGTKPAERVNPNAVKVMAEVGIDISNNIANNVSDFIEKDFDLVITVCDNAKESCPVFIGSVKKQIHIGFEDPVDATGTEEEILDVYRTVRNQIKEKFFELYMKEIINHV